MGVKFCQDLSFRSSYGVICASWTVWTISKREILNRSAQLYFEKTFLVTVTLRQKLPHKNIVSTRHSTLLRNNLSPFTQYSISLGWTSIGKPKTKKKRINTHTSDPLCPLSPTLPCWPSSPCKLSRVKGNKTIRSFFRSPKLRYHWEMANGENYNNRFLLQLSLRAKAVWRWGLWVNTMKNGSLASFMCQDRW